MYTLNCNYYKAEFDNINDLIDDVMMSGMDPCYEIVKDGVKTGERVDELLTY